MDDEVIQGMTQAQTRHGISGGSTLSTTDIISAVDEIRSRPPVPYVPPVRLINSVVPDSERVFTPEVKRVSVILLLGTGCATFYSVVTANGATIVAIVAPWIGGAIGVSSLALLWGSLVSGRSERVDRGESVGGRAEVHYHYYQYNNQGHGPQNNNAV